MGLVRSSPGVLGGMTLLRESPLPERRTLPCSVNVAGRTAGVQAVQMGSTPEEDDDRRLETGVPLAANAAAAALCMRWSCLLLAAAARAALRAGLAPSSACLAAADISSTCWTCVGARPLPEVPSSLPSHASFACTGPSATIVFVAAAASASAAGDCWPTMLLSC